MAGWAPGPTPSRADTQRPLAGGRYRAAAGTALRNVDHRDLHRQPGGIAADARAAGHQHVAAMDDAGLGGRAAHVEGDRVLEPDAIAQRLGADDARRRSGFEHPDAGALRLLDAEQTAARLHDPKVTAKAGGREMIADLAEIAPHARPEVGLRGRPRGASER